SFDQAYGAYPESALAVRHPHDVDIWIGNAAALHRLPDGVDAVVSLCRVADEHIPDGATHLDVRLIDRVGDNANLDFVLLDTVRAVEQLRAENRTVYLHCVHAYSRTPTIAALYGARRQGIGIERALDEVCAVLSGANPNPEFRDAVRRLHSGDERPGSPLLTVMSASGVGPGEHEDNRLGNEHWWRNRWKHSVAGRPTPTTNGETGGARMIDAAVRGCHIIEW